MNVPEKSVKLKKTASILFGVEVVKALYYYNHNEAQSQCNKKIRNELVKIKRGHFIFCEFLFRSL